VASSKHQELSKKGGAGHVFLSFFFRSLAFELGKNAYF